MRGRAATRRLTGPAVVGALCLPLAVFCWPAFGLAGHPAAALRALGLAACATLASLMLAAPAVASRRAAWWLLPGCGTAVLALLQARGGAAHDAARAACGGLPLMALALAACWQAVPDGILRAASCAGARTAARAGLAATLFVPGAAAACLAVFLLCLGLLVRQP